MGGIENPEELLHGIRQEAVIRAIKERARNGDSRADNRKLGLVIEGGSVRAASSAGGAVALAQLGYSNTFDQVYATSSGVMNAAYFISNQPLTGISVYFENCVSWRFVNPFRFWKIIDADYIFDEVAETEKPLNTTRIRESPAQFQVAVIDRADGQGSLIDVKEPGNSMLKYLKASAAIPVFYNRSVKIRGQQFIDGGLRIPFPLKQAIDQGCTDILVLLTRPKNYVAHPPSAFSRITYNIMCARGHRGLKEAFQQGYERSREYRDLAFGRSEIPEGINIATIATNEPEIIKGIAVSEKILRQAAIEYGRKTLEIFGRSNEKWEIGQPANIDS